MTRLDDLKGTEFMTLQSDLVSKAATAAARLLRVRWFVRAPIWLFRARLGFLFGSRLLLLEHVGRTTGMRRFVVLEVVAHPDADTYVVASGFGETAQWFRNVQAHPRVWITAGIHQRQPAISTLLEAQRAGAALAAYRREHPRAWQALRPVFEQTLGAHIGEHDTSLPLIAFTLVQP